MEVTCNLKVEQTIVKELIQKDMYLRIDRTNTYLGIGKAVTYLLTRSGGKSSRRRQQACRDHILATLWYGFRPIAGRLKSQTVI